MNREWALVYALTVLLIYLGVRWQHVAVAFGGWWLVRHAIVIWRSQIGG